MFRSLGTLGIALALSASLAHAAVVIDWVTVGDPGNAADTRYATPGYGAVTYIYRMSKFEITNGQYREFLNAKASLGDPYGLADNEMGGLYGGMGCTGSGTPGDPYVYIPKGNDTAWDSRPVNFVSLWDAARFVNWLHNGQGDGDTETGAYINIGGASFARQPDAQFFLPTEDEWYKAAYYKGGSTNAGYWDYATQSDTTPASESPPGGENSANYYGSTYAIGSPYYMTPVGAYALSESAYGTFDQSGNVWEWNETVNGSFRGWRGGSWRTIWESLPASYSYWIDPAIDAYNAGFRIASPLSLELVPEPSAVVMLLVGVIGLLVWKRRRWGT